LVERVDRPNPDLDGQKRLLATSFFVVDNNNTIHKTSRNIASLWTCYHCTHHHYYLHVPTTKHYSTVLQETFSAAK
jgi:hypothetical protein